MIEEGENTLAGAKGEVFSIQPEKEQTGASKWKKTFRLKKKSDFIRIYWSLKSWKLKVFVFH